MEDNSEILKLISDYENLYEDDEANTSAIKSFLAQFSGEQLFDRKNFTGHITSSAYIINPKKDSLLLLRHKFLQRWLQPGGHVDNTDASLLQAALRESEEETGIAKTHLSLANKNIFNIDSHPIPANEKKQEPAHVHHDISFLFYCNINELHIDEHESTAGKWVAFSTLMNDAEYQPLIARIKSLI